MNIIEIALYSSAIFAAIVFYKITTIRMALAARQGMVPIVRDIIHDDSVPNEVKDFAMGAFHLSARPDFLRNFIWAIVTKRIKPDRSRARHFSDHSKLVDRVVREHLFRINVLAAPHWYLILFLGIVFITIIGSFVTLGTTMGKNLGKLTTRISNPEWFVVHCTEKDC